MQIKMLSTIASALLLGGFVVGCGSSDSSTPIVADDGVVTQKSIEGKAVDGYLRYSTVCLDLSKDGYCQPSEPYTLTDEDGSFTLTLTDLHRGHDNFETAPLLVYGGQDSDTAEDFVGKLKSPNDGTASINVTPLTTLVAEISGGDKTKIAAAKTKVATILGLNDSDIGGDPVDLAKKGDSAPLSRALEVQKAVERMVKGEVGDTAKASSASALYAALANTMDTPETAVATDVSDIIQSSRSAIADLVSSADINGSIALSTLVKQAIGNTQSFTADSISEVATQISATKNENTITTSTTLKSAEDAKSEAIDSWITYLDIPSENQQNFKGLFDSVLTINMTLTQMKAALTTQQAVIIAKINAKLAEIAEDRAAAEEAQEEAELAAKPFLAINTPFYMYDIDSWMDWNGTSSYRTYEIWQDTFTDGSVTWSGHKFVDGEWTTNGEELDYVLQSDGTWGESDLTFTVQSDNSLMTNEGGKFGIVSSTDIAGSHTVELSSTYELNVTMPEGAEQFVSKYEVGADAYKIWEPKRDYWGSGSEPITYIQTLNEVIEKQCGTYWFMGDESGGYAFAATETQEATEENGWQSYTCNSSETSGKLYEVKEIVRSQDGFDYHKNSIISTNAGTWERKRVNNQEMIIVTPYDSSKYDSEESRIFLVANPDGEGDRVWEGEYEKKGSVRTWKSYNEIAIEAIKKHIMELEN